MRRIHRGSISAWVLAVCTVFLALSLLMPTEARAATAAGDGLELTLTADQSSYRDGELVHLSVSVRNTNAYAVSGVTTTVALPPGFSLAGGSLTSPSRDLGPGESMSSTLAAQPSGSGGGSVPATGDGSLLLLWLPLLGLACAGLFLLRRGPRRGSRFLALLLCAVLGCLGLGPAAVRAASPLSVTLPVSYGGATVAFGASAAYGAPLLTRLTLTPDNLILQPGQSARLTAAPFPAGAPFSPSWRTGNAAVATVDGSGLVTAVGPGTTHITVSDSASPAISAACTVTIPTFNLSVQHAYQQTAAYGAVSITQGAATGNVLGSSVTVTATPQPGYSFWKWVATDDLAAAPVSTDAAYTFPITHDTRLYAVFSRDGAGLPYIVDASGAITNGMTASGVLMVPNVVDNIIVTSVGSGAFQGNNALITIGLPGTVTSVGDHAFENCSRLAATSFGSEALRTIGASAYANTALAYYIFPGDVASVAGSAFAGCTSLSFVTFTGDRPSLVSVGAAGDTFDGCSALTAVQYTPWGTGWPGAAVERGGTLSALTPVPLP